MPTLPRPAVLELIGNTPLVRVSRSGLRCLDLGDCLHEFSFTKFGRALNTQLAGQSLKLGDAKSGEA